MTVGELIKLLLKAGWVYESTTGGHRHFHHPEKIGTITLNGQYADRILDGALYSVKKRAGLL